MDALIFITTYLKDSVMHFWFSGAAGLLAFLLTLTILYAAIRIYRSNVPLAWGQKYSILCLALLVAFVAVWSSHLAMDYFTDWWTTPLGAPLAIIK